MGLKIGPENRSNLIVAKKGYRDTGERHLYVWIVFRYKKPAIYLM